MQPLPTAGRHPSSTNFADQLGLDVTAFVETFGAGWFQAEVIDDFDADPSGGWGKRYDSKAPPSNRW